ADHLVVASAADVTGDDGAVHRRRFAVGLLPLGPEVGLGHLALNDVPGEDLVLGDLAVGEEVDSHAVFALHLLRRLEPDVVAEMVRPTVEALAPTIGGEDGGGHAAIPAGEEGLDAGALRLRI